MVTFLLVCRAVAGPLFVVAFLAEGVTRADYDALQQPVSALALGKWGWTNRPWSRERGCLTVLPCASSGPPACDFRTVCLTVLPVASSA
jgi:hypothetical protein